MDSLCHPCIKATHLSYSVLSLKLPPPSCPVLLVIYLKIRACGMYTMYMPQISIKQIWGKKHHENCHVASHFAAEAREPLRESMMLDLGYRYARYVWRDLVCRVSKISPIAEESPQNLLICLFWPHWNRHSTMPGVSHFWKRKVFLPLPPTSLWFRTTMNKQIHLATKSVALSFLEPSPRNGGWAARSWETSPLFWRMWGLWHEGWIQRCLRRLAARIY